MTAEVPHSRTIVVDRSLTIIAIISNTTQDVSPTIRLESDKGAKIASSAAVLAQYDALKPTLDFSIAGNVYERGRVRTVGTEDHDWVAQLTRFIRTVFETLAKMLGLG